MFSELKHRGVEDVLIAFCDGLKGLPEAISAAVHRPPDPQLVPLCR